MKQVSTYKAPETGIIALLPRSWIPYAELMRLDRPQGFYAIYWHYLIGLGFASCTAPTLPDVLVVVSLAVFLAIWTVVLRGVACTWNDIFDQDFDRQVERTRFRPLARRAVSTTQAVLFSLFLMVILGVLCVPLPSASRNYAGLKTLVLCLYPLAKRITHLPQVVLGFGLALSVLMCVTILSEDPPLRARHGGDESSSSPSFLSVVSFYFACAIWTIISDTIYAHQDLTDDIKAGVKSLAVLLGGRTILYLSVLSTIQVALLVLAGTECGYSFFYYLICCLGTACSLGTMLIKVDLRQPDSCAWWFGPGARLVAGCLVCGLFGEYGYRRMEQPVF
ncbi:hypothetical protein TMatcc_001113 [Talaromyces marneffei ATCC 18224]|uniref:4-hydroxybenzoate octaprenyltransferase, putative n=1 Tax=Talaromyces marneffei (strain ATCC 18224 / CBS 334.59 / QM 7333) TaxID=441960 RepID=B6QRU8_TALMQ|nr:4-hydroxybenzoate octaprenyltransferase, putative [Talaromyces marneffei ATCC 18224]KAE8550043.1 hypothetical protein EYB25_008574 [Talaromyces marneffei]